MGEGAGLSLDLAWVSLLKTNQGGGGGLVRLMHFIMRINMNGAPHDYNKQHNENNTNKAFTQ